MTTNTSGSPTPAPDEQREDNEARWAPKGAVSAGAGNELADPGCGRRGVEDFLAPGRLARPAFFMCCVFVFVFLFLFTMRFLLFIYVSL